MTIILHSLFFNPNTQCELGVKKKNKHAKKERNSLIINNKKAI